MNVRFMDKELTVDESFIKQFETLNAALRYGGQLYIPYESTLFLNCQRYKEYDTQRICEIANMVNHLNNPQLLDDILTYLANSD